MYNLKYVQMRIHTYYMLLTTNYKNKQKEKIKINRKRYKFDKYYVIVYETV